MYTYLRSTVFCKVTTCMITACLSSFRGHKLKKQTNQQQQVNIKYNYCYRQIFYGFLISFLAFKVSLY